MTRFRMCNPESKLYISKIDGIFTLTTSEDIETLKMPVGFYYVKNPKTGEITITNKTKGDIKALKFNYRQVTRGAKKVAKTTSIKAVEEKTEEVVSVNKEKPEFSSEKRKVAKHLKQETKNETYRKFKGLLQYASELPIANASSLTKSKDKASISQGLAKVLNGMAKLGDILAGKIHSLAQKLGKNDQEKLQAKIVDIKTYKKDCEIKATSMAS